MGRKGRIVNTDTCSPDLLRNMEAYWRAANYLSVGQIYLLDNPLLKDPLKMSHVKPRVVGHWGTTPGQNFIYVHLNRIIKKYDLNMFYIAGPGHGGPALLANTYLECTYSEIYPNISQDEAGLQKLFMQFSFPGGIPRSEEHTSELQSPCNLVCRLLLEKKRSASQLPCRPGCCRSSVRSEASAGARAAT